MPLHNDVKWRRPIVLEPAHTWNPNLEPDPEVLAAVPGVLACYPIEPATRVEIIVPLRRNENFRIQTADGKKFVLRRHRRNPDPARVAFQLAFQSYLHGRGFPALEAIPTTGGDLTVWDPDGPWVLFPHGQGEHLDYTRLDQVAEAGRRLAEFHLISASYAGNYTRCDLNPDVELWWTDAPHQIHALADRYGEDALAAELAALRQAHIDFFPAARLAALSRGWVHSDYHGRNLLFAGDRITCLLDFDPLHRGFIVEDIAFGLFMFGRVVPGSVEMRPEALRLFLRAYLSVKPLAPADLEALPLFIWLPTPPFLPYLELVERDGQDPIGYAQNRFGQISLKRSSVAPLIRNVVAEEVGRN